MDDLVSFAENPEVLTLRLPTVHEFISAPPKQRWYLMKVCGLIVRKTDTSVRCSFVRDDELSPALRHALFDMLTEEAMLIDGDIKVSESDRATLQ